MDHNQLKAFYSIVQTGSFSKAARVLGLTQPAVSKQIQSLEHFFAARLFDRQGKKISLTSEGEMLLAYVKRLFDLNDEIINLFKSQQLLKKGKLKFASTRVLGTYFLSKIIGLFNRQYPGIEINFRQGNSARILDAVVNAEVDFGFAGDLLNHANLDKTLIHQEKLLIVSSPGHYLTKVKPCSIEDIINVPFVWREKGTLTQEVVAKWFKNSVGKKYPKKAIELEHVETAKRIVIEGYGITIIPESAVKQEITAGILKPIEVSGFDHSINFYFLHFKDKIFSKAAITFLTLLSNMDLFSHSQNLVDKIKEFE